MSSISLSSFHVGLGNKHTVIVMLIVKLHVQYTSFESRTNCIAWMPKYPVSSGYFALENNKSYCVWTFSINLGSMKVIQSKSAAYAGICGSVSAAKSTYRVNTNKRRASVLCRPSPVAPGVHLYRGGGCLGLVWVRRGGGERTVLCYSLSLVISRGGRKTLQ